MEDLLKESVKQVPALVVLVVMAWLLINLFLKQAAETRRDYLESFKVMHGENLEARALSREAVKENTVVSREANESLLNMTSAIRALEVEIHRMNGHKPDPT